MLVHTSQNKKIQISDTPLGEGGEGKVYEVLNPSDLQNYVVKVYHPHERTPEREAKLRYLQAHRPPLLDDFSVIWVEDLVYEKDEFVGFLMLKAVSSVDLTFLTGLQVSDKLSAEWLEKYSRHSLQGFQNRAKLCYNIASAVSQIHQSQQYVLVDLKPENLKIKLNGQVSLIDTDSIQVLENEQVIFPAQKLSPEYSPAEIKQLSLAKDYIPETWDRFSLAVVFYKVLFGLHPFAVTGKAEYQNLHSHEQKIQAGLFPFGEKSADIQVVPPPHANFEALPFAMRMLFIRAFDQGYNLPATRPTAHEWCEQLLDFKPINPNYQNPSQAKQAQRPAFASAKPAFSKKFDETSSIVARLVIVFFIIAAFSSFFNRMDWLDFGNRKAEEIATISLEQAKKTIEEIKNNQIDRNKIERINLGYNYYAVQARGYAYWGISNEAGKLITNLEYESIEPFESDLAIFKKDGKFGMFNPDLKIAINNEYDYLDNASESLILAQQAGKFGYLFLDGSLAIPFKFEDAESFSEGKAKVKINDEEFFIDRQGKCIENCGTTIK
jgi:serine/threonine protein kinase